MDGAVKEIVSIFSGIVVLGIIATLVSRNANTANIISNTFSGFSHAVSAAEGPVTGSSGIGSSLGDLGSFPNLNY